MMRKEGKKQSKFKHYISTPFRILKKAKELYIKVLVDCAGRISCDAAGSAVQISQTKCVNKLNAGERVVTSRNMGTEMGAFRQRQRRIVGCNNNNRRRIMSYHTEVRKMGRIDEDKPCSFEEEDANYHSNPNLLYLYPRTRINV